MRMPRSKMISLEMRSYSWSDSCQAVACPTLSCEHGEGQKVAGLLVGMLTLYLFNLPFNPLQHLETFLSRPTGELSILAVG